MPGPPPRQQEHEARYHSRTHSFKQGEYERMIMTSKLYSVTLWAKRFLTFCLTGEEKPRKNLTQETCSDRGSNAGPLREKRACYLLLLSGGRFNNNKNKNIRIIITIIIIIIIVISHKELYFKT